MIANPPSDWKLERYLLGELPAPEMEEVRKAAESDPSVRRRLEQLKLSDQDILRRYPAELMIGQIQARILVNPLGLARKGMWRLRWQPLAGAATLVLVLTVWIYHTHFQHPAVGTIASSITASSATSSERSSAGVSAAGNAKAKPLPGRNAKAQNASVPVPLHSHTPGVKLAGNAFPRQKVFPSPRLTEEDRLLVAYAQDVATGTVTPAGDPAMFPPFTLPVLEIPRLEIPIVRIEPLPGETGNLRK